MRYLVVIEENEDRSGFGAYVPDLPGCVAVGDTDERAKERIAVSISLLVESHRPYGEPAPPPLSASRNCRRGGLRPV